MTVAIDPRSLLLAMFDAAARKPKPGDAAYNFFKPLGDLVTPGPTFTNVNDFRAPLIV